MSPCNGQVRCSTGRDEFGEVWTRKLVQALSKTYLGYPRNRFEIGFEQVFWPKLPQTISKTLCLKTRSTIFPVNYGDILRHGNSRDPVFPGTRKHPQSRYTGPSYTWIPCIPGTHIREAAGSTPGRLRGSKNRPPEATWCVKPRIQSRIFIQQVASGDRFPDPRKRPGIYPTASQDMSGTRVYPGHKNTRDAERPTSIGLDSNATGFC